MANPLRCSYCRARVGAEHLCRCLRGTGTVTEEHTETIPLRTLMGQTPMTTGAAGEKIRTRTRTDPERAEALRDSLLGPRDGRPDVDDLFL
jgi:hypothetical protein